MGALEHWGLPENPSWLARNTQSVAGTRCPRWDARAVSVLTPELLGRAGCGAQPRAGLPPPLGGQLQPRGESELARLAQLLLGSAGLPQPLLSLGAHGEPCLCLNEPKKGRAEPAALGLGQCPGQDVPLSSSRPDWSIFMAQAERPGD